LSVGVPIFIFSHAATIALYSRHHACGGGEANASSCLNGFSLFSDVQTLLGDRDSIASGKIGSNGITQVGIDGKSHGDLTSRGNITIRDRAKIFGNVKSGGTVALLSGTSVTGTINQMANVASCAIPQVSVTTGTQDIQVNNGTTVDLPPGSYRDVMIYGNCKLKFRTGIYHFRSFTTYADGRLEFNPGSGNVEILISASLNVGDRTQFHFSGQILPERLKFHSQQTSTLTIGTDVTFRGTLQAPLAPVKAYSRTLFQGAVYGKSIDFEPDVKVFHSAFSDLTPVVAIHSPPDGYVTDQESILVTWSVDGTPQNTLVTQQLTKGVNSIERTAKDGAGNIGLARVIVRRSDSAFASIPENEHTTRDPKIHDIPFNQTVRLELIPGDVLLLTGFPPPSDSAFDQITATFNRAQVDTLQLVMMEAGKRYSLTGMNSQVRIPYGGGATQKAIAYSGLDTVDMKWGLTKAPKEPNPFAPTIRDLGPPGSVYSDSLSEGIFTISRFPTSPFTVLTVRIEAKDGRALQGQINTLGGERSLSGMAQEFMFKEVGTATLVFDLAFPERRKISVTWSTENRSPAQRVVPRTVSGSDSGLQTTYRFTQDHMVNTDLTLFFTSEDFVDGEPPNLARLEHNPPGVRGPYTKGLEGPVFSVNGNIRTGKTVTMALPIPENAKVYGFEADSVKLLHYLTSTSTWVEVLPDSIVGGYAYFTASSFSLWRVVVNVTKSAGSAAVDMVKASANGIKAVSGAIVDGLSDAMVGFYNWALGDCVQMGVDQFISLGISTGKPTTWSVPQINPFNPDPAYGGLGDLARQVWGAGGARLLNCTPTDATTEAHCWEVYKANAELLLADVILSKFGYPRRFIVEEVKPGGYTGTWMAYMAFGYPNHKVIDRFQSANPETFLTHDIFGFSSELLASIPVIRKTLKACDGAFTYEDEYERTADDIDNWMRSLGSNLGACNLVSEMVGNVIDIAASFFVDPIHCGISAVQTNNYWGNHHLNTYWLGEGRDAHIIGPSHFFNVFVLLLATDDQYKKVYRNHAHLLRDEIHAGVGFLHKAFQANNIIINAMAGVAFWDWLSKGDLVAFNTMKTMLENKMSPDGAYAEGTGYLQEEINAELPYLLSAMVRAGAIRSAELPRNYLQSGAKLLNSLRATKPAGNSGNTIFLPSEVDDGVVGEVDWLSYTTLTNDWQYAAFHQANPNAKPQSRSIHYAAFPAVPPDPSFAIVPRLPQVAMVGDAATVRAVNSTLTETMTLSMVAENGLLRFAGLGHDQQDNTSVTLDHSREGRIIVDPGYNGFGNRDETDGNFARFSSHNVLSLPGATFGGESSNGKFTYGDAVNIIKGWAPHLFSIGIPDLQMLLDWVIVSMSPKPISPLTDFHAGGADAFPNRLIANSSRLPSYGLEVWHSLSQGYITNRRTALYFADHMWVIDRAEQMMSLQTRLNWASNAEGANSSYISNSIQAETPASITTVTGPPVTFVQHGSNPIFAQQVTRGNGTVNQAPVFVTGYPISGIPTNFISESCDIGVCIHRTTASAEEWLIVPSWDQFREYTSGVIPIFRQGGYSPWVTGQIVLARRRLGSSNWAMRLIGEGPGIPALTDFIWSPLHTLM
jgi:hypothetical protein